MAQNRLVWIQFGQGLRCVTLQFPRAVANHYFTNCFEILKLFFVMSLLQPRSMCHHTYEAEMTGPVPPWLYHHQVSARIS